VKDKTVLIILVSKERACHLRTQPKGTLEWALTGLRACHRHHLERRRRRHGRTQPGV